MRVNTSYRVSKTLLIVLSISTILLTGACAKRRAALVAAANVQRVLNAINCSIVPSATTAKVGDTITFSINASGGTAPYTFSLAAGQNGTISALPAMTSSSEASASAIYSGAADPMPTLTATDSTGLSGTCLTSLHIDDVSVPISPVGFFRMADNGFLAQATKHYCKFPGKPEWYAAGGMDWNSAPTYSEISSDMILDGTCQASNGSSNAPPDPVGFFLVTSNAGLYLADANKHYCYYTSPGLYYTVGGADPNLIPKYSSIPASMISDGECRIPNATFFKVGGAVYKVLNSQGSYCFIPTATQYQMMQGPSLSSLRDMTPIPKSMTLSGECAMPVGFFRVGSNLFFANSNNGYCRYTSLNHFYSAGGQNPWTTAPDYARVSSSAIYKQDCWLNQGLFRLGSDGFYADDRGHYCSLSTSAWIAFTGGEVALASVPDYSPIPNTMTNDGACGVTTASVAIYRLHNKSLDWLPSFSPNEGSPTYVLDGVAMHLYPVQVKNTSPIYRCYQKTGSAMHHYMSLSADCEMAGKTNEGRLGFVVNNPTPGTYQLYRLINTTNSAFISTYNAAEIKSLVDSGKWKVQGPQGFVFP